MTRTLGFCRIVPAVLAAVLASDCEPPLTGVHPEVGTLLVRMTTRGLDLDPNGYAVGTTPDSAALVPANGTGTVDLPVGGRIVTLTDQARNCVPVGPISHSVVIRKSETTTLDLEVVCFRDPILFNRERPSGSDPNIWVVDASGGPAVDLTGDVGGFAWLNGTDLALSPDRTRLVFSADWGDRSSTVYVMALNKSSLYALAGSDDQSEPAWSPDGSQIAYVSYRPGGTTNIAIAYADGRPARAFVTTGAWEFSPTWSPDGAQILFERNAAADDRGSRHLFAMNADGTGLLQVTDGSPAAPYAFALDGEARWSPDGARIVFSRRATDSAYTVMASDLWTVNADGANLARLTDSPMVRDRYPEWRDDGAALVWSECVGDCDPTVVAARGTAGFDLWQMNADGTGATNLTGCGTFVHPAWNATRTFDGTASPATFLVATRYEGGTFHLYRLNADGSEPVALTDGSMSDVNPQWR